MLGLGSAQPLVWLPKLASSLQHQVVARHVTEYNVKAIKFSPYEEGRLMTCGKNSIRMFRLKVGGPQF